MTAFNVQSLFAFYAIFSIIGGLIACFYFKRLDTSARYWVVSTLIIGVTNLATLFRSELPLLWSYSIPIGLNGMAFVLMGLGITRLHHSGPQWRSLLSLGIGTLVFIVLMEWCRLQWGLRVTVVLSGGLFAATSFWGSYAAHVYYKRSGNPFATHMRSVMVGIGVVNLLRTQGSFTGWGLETFGTDAWTLGIWSVLFLLGMLRYFVYFGMRVQEQSDERLKVMTALAREEEGRSFGNLLAQQDRQRSLGVMSSSFAHELNQPLTAIIGYAQLLQYQQKSGQWDPQASQSMLETIVQNAERAGFIIRRIRNFIEPSAVKIEPVDLCGVIDEVLALVEPEARRGTIEIFKPILPTVPVYVLGDAVQLSQVLFNLVRNAMESVAQVQSRCVRLDIRQEGPEILIEIHDTGPGLSETDTKMAGEAFYTTKASGLGMGLTISKTILAQFDGRLTLQNTANGACARITLPLAKLT